MVPRSVLRAAERAGGFGATTNDLGVVAAAIAATTGLSTGGRGLSSEVRHTREIRCACARVATCAATVRLDAAAATAAPPVPRALVVHDSHRPVCCTDAGHSASAAPLQRSLGAPLLPATETAGRPERAGTVAMRSRR